MSFFRFDGEHNGSAPGSAQGTGSITGLSKDLQKRSHDITDLDDIYDGLGDQLDETGDDFNDDTFGERGDETTNFKSVGNDYDFFGKTAVVSRAMSSDQARFNRQKPGTSLDTENQSPRTLSRPSKPNHERLSKCDQVPEMLVDASIWGVPPKRVASALAPESLVASRFSSDKRKIMSVEEIETNVLAQAMNMSQQSQGREKYLDHLQRSQSTAPQQQFQFHSSQSREINLEPYGRLSLQDQLIPATMNQTTNIPQSARQSMVQIPSNLVSPKLLRLQSPNRSASELKSYSSPRSLGFNKNPKSSRNFDHAHHLSSLSNEERATAIMNEMKSEKRNRKIFLLSKDNGLMTPQDKNFINRIQLQQLVTAIGYPNDGAKDMSFIEDFYYQVHHQIHGGHRDSMTTQSQSTNRYGGMRGQIWGSSSHIKQMEQQVQRAVEAAKSRSKSKQLSIEGNLGKISFSNAKTPKPLLNIRSPENGSEGKSVSAARDRKMSQFCESGSDRKTVLTDIERVYNTLMEMEDHDRKMPFPVNGKDIDNCSIGLNKDWHEKAQKMNQRLWHQLKVHEPIGATVTHPFIAFLSYGKGMKAFPRVFRHISKEQRTTILTMIILHLDQLDTVRQGLIASGQAQLSSEIREKIEQFSLSVMPPLFSYLNETGLDIINGILGLLLTIKIDLVARTKIGISMLTMILSRAELIKQSRAVEEKHEWDQWIITYNTFFDTLEPIFSDIFPSTANSGEEIYVWQFLAAIGIGASPTQQQRLVMAVKDRVMEAISFAKTLPLTISKQRLGNVNLFLRSIGLDVELLA